MRPGETWRDRIELLESLPKNSVAAELGVLSGSYSGAILRCVRPRLLHLIDAWDRNVCTETASPQEKFTRAHGHVLKQFAGQIKDGAVVVHKTTTHAAVSIFADGYFDWVYVDAGHTYEEALSDLEDYWPKIRTGGFLLGHDFAQHPLRGVVPAVVEFLRRRVEAEFVGVTAELVPSFAIRKP